MNVTNTIPSVLLTILALAAASCAADRKAPYNQATTMTPSTPTTSSSFSTPVKTAHVAVNGVNYYYEIHGRGEPLLLLPGVSDRSTCSRESYCPRSRNHAR